MITAKEARKMYKDEVQRELHRIVTKIRCDSPSKKNTIINYKISDVNKNKLQKVGFQIQERFDEIRRETTTEITW